MTAPRFVKTPGKHQGITYITEENVVEQALKNPTMRGWSPGAIALARKQLTSKQLREMADAIEKKAQTPEGRAEILEAAKPTWRQDLETLSDKTNA